MQNKLLRASLLCAVIFLSIRELGFLLNGLIIRGLNYFFVDADVYSWHHVFWGVQDALFGVEQLSLLVAGLVLIIGAFKSIPALMGGIFLCSYSMFVDLRMVSYYIFREPGMQEVVSGLYAQWIIWPLIVLFAAAFICIALHYKSQAMLWLSVGMMLVRMVMQTAVVAMNHGWIGYTWYSLITGIVGIVLFAFQLVVLILWFRKAKQ